MKTPDAGLIASVRDRLQNQAKIRRENFEQILYRYAIERFLYRLSRSEFGDSFVLKGGQVFIAWGVPLGRPTRDIDILGYSPNSIDFLEQIVRDVAYNLLNQTAWYLIRRV